MAQENIKMQEVMESLQSIAQDVLKIEEKMHKLNEESHKAMLQETNEEFLGKQYIPINKVNFEEQEEKGKKAYKVEQIDEKEQVENPKLVISERTGCVYLPYSQSDIEYYKKCGYGSKEEIIRMFYTVPLKRYANFSKSRVKERICINER